MKLCVLPAAAYQPFMADLKVRYTADQRQAFGLSDASAETYVDNQWAQILPDGQETQGHYFFQLVDDAGSTRGEAWLYVDDSMGLAFIYELYLHPDARGRGLGREALEALADFARSHGATSFGLNVFADNERARALYRSFGFSEVSSNMVMPLETAPE